MKKDKSLTGFTMIEVISVTAIVGVLIALAIPSTLKIRGNAHEAAAQSALRTIGSAMSAYQLEKSTYPSDLSQLAPGSNAPVNIEEAVATGVKLGYRFQMDSADQDSYRVIATPENPPVTGNHTFILTETGVIQNGGPVIVTTGTTNATGGTSGAY